MVVMVVVCVVRCAVEKGDRRSACIVKDKVVR
jgi:hypothetical protein